MKLIVRLVAVLALIQILILNVPCSRAQVQPEHFDLPVTKAEVVSNIQAKAKSLKGLIGQFHQIKLTRLLTSPLESQGNFQWQPPQNLRWEVTQPALFRMILKGDEVLLHYVDLNRASVYRHPIGNSLLGRFTGIASNEESLERAYNLQVASVQTGESEGEALIQLCMQPKSSQQSRYLRQIEVLIDPVSWLPQKIIISEANDDTNIIILSDLIENGLIRDGLFDVTPPNGVHLMQFPGGKTQ